ncbi:hypothetical protein Anapl_00450 [Anas platyrhynchos]|uniref:Uncharacterized protein n=1 Tax=Anas platyrhynchos TaxID=8839 RepID=R0L5U8_ANAPL|nr:hypothetical protein Anapl_00450 [Anas platyrhynchos]
MGRRAVACWQKSEHDVNHKKGTIGIIRQGEDVYLWHTGVNQLKAARFTPALQRRELRSGAQSRSAFICLTSAQVVVMSICMGLSVEDLQPSSRRQEAQGHRWMNLGPPAFTERETHGYLDCLDPLTKTCRMHFEYTISPCPSVTSLSEHCLAPVMTKSLALVDTKDQVTNHPFSNECMKGMQENQCQILDISTHCSITVSRLEGFLDTKASSTPTFIRQQNMTINHAAFDCRTNINGLLNIRQTEDNDEYGSDTRGPHAPATLIQHRAQISYLLIYELSCKKPQLCMIHPYKLCKSMDPVPKQKDIKANEATKQSNCSCPFASPSMGLLPTTV